MRRILLGLAVLASCAQPLLMAARADDGPLASESVLARSQPSVFLTLSYANFNVTIPKKVALVNGPDGSPLVFADYESLKTAGRIRAESKKSDCCWVLVANDPARYLTVAEKLSKKEPLEVFSGGTAFAVSQEGILLTNAHNLTDPPDGEVPIRSLIEVLDRTIDELSGMTEIEAVIGRKGAPKEAPSFGGRPANDVETPVIQKLYTWMLNQSSSTDNKFQEILVVLDHRDKPDLSRPGTQFPAYRFGSPGTKKALQGKFDALCLNEITSGKAQGRLTTVLAIGEVYPGKDVAVLKLKPEQLGGKSDPILCLSLGDSDRVLAGTSIVALGFPGAAFDPATMKESARFRVIAEDGRITQRLPYKSGIDFFHMTAQIDHGHSGGPVVDQSGRVVAINVAGLPNSNIRLAIPINVAKEFLDKAGIKPDPGPLTQHWLAGHALFQKGDYVAAEREFAWVAERQDPMRKRRSFDDKHPLSDSGSDHSNSYVQAMIRECQSRAAKR